MIPYDSTPSYTGHVDRLLADVGALEQRLSSTLITLKSIKRGDPAAIPLRKERNALRMKLRFRNDRLARVRSLHMPMWDLVRILMDVDGTVWSLEQRGLWHKDLASCEGRGEASLRAWHGLPIKSATHADLDIPELGIEVKNVQGRRNDGKFAIQTIQAAAAGKRAYAKWLMHSAMAGLFNGLDATTIECLGTGELSSRTLANLPSGLRCSLLAAVAPSVVFSRCDAIDFTTRDGFIHVNRVDFDRALNVESITLCGPKYALRSAYVLFRLESSASQHVADKAA